jgi:putative endonuclease
MGFVYILELINKSYYIGSTKNILQRLREHTNGYVYSTKNKLPFQLIYTQEFETYKEARKEEIRIKSWKKRSSIENLCYFGKNNIAKKIAPIV